MIRVAFLADIHGNLPALEAVAADISCQSPDAVYLVGDQINRCPWSNEVMDFIADKGWHGIYGNHELVIRRLSAPHAPLPFDNRSRFPDLWWTLERLDPVHMETVRTLPPEMSLDFGEGAPIRLVHGVPGNPFRGVFLDTAEDDVLQSFGEVDEPIIVCGHTHRPLRRTVVRWQIFNGGSVGMPYNGDPRAQYLVLSSRNKTWTPAFRKVEYPIGAVRRGFVEHTLYRAYGPLAEIYLRTVEAGQPWISDFGHWMNTQPPDVQTDIDRAVAIYQRSHGPGNWSFP